MTDRPGLENVADAYPLTPMQEGMLFHALAEPGSEVFENQRTIEVDGELDLAAFRAAWERLVERYDVLRTAFVWDGLDRPLQVVGRSAALEWDEHDWIHLTPDEQSQRFGLLQGEDMQRGFDLQAAPLMRMAMIRVREDRWRWLWTSHHLIADAWSVQVLLDELQAIYAELRGGPVAHLPEPSSYQGFVDSVLARDAARDEAFWRPRLAGFTAPHRLEVPGLPPAPDAAGHRAVTVELEASSSAALRAAAAAEGVTLNSAVLAAWAVQLSRWTRDTDVVFGTTTAGRDVTVPGVERAVGLFINTLPIRLSVDGEQSVADSWRTAQRHQQELYPFEHSSLAAVQRWSDAPGGDPLFESIFVFGNRPAPASEDPSAMILRTVEFTEHSNYPLAILVEPGSSIQLRFIYDSARFAPAAVESLASQTVNLLAQCAHSPGMRLAELERLPVAELGQMRAFETGPPLDPTEETIHQLIARTAAERPDAPAVVFEDQVLTYRQLEEAAGRVAVQLQAAGVGPNRPVGLYLRRSAELIVGMLGILKAGGAYVPLDPDYPAGHIQRLLEGDGIDIVLTDESRRHEVPAVATVVTIEGDGPAEAGPAPPVVAPNADDLAYVIHTSGSTGHPKGVMVSHRNLVQSTRARAAHYRRAVGRFLLLSSFAFDSSVAGIFWTLSSGGTLLLPSPGLEHDINRLLALAATQRATHLLGLPALYEVMLERLGAGELDSLEVAIVAGEACPPRVLAAHLANLPQTELHNEYGPTEATVWCTVHRAEQTDQGAPLPIGRPIAGTTVHLLDDHGHRVPAGFIGELWVGGAGVTGGYLNRPDLTAERFATVRLDNEDHRLYRTGDLACYRAGDGALMFLGRADVQLKVRGHRIEPEAVEEALRAHTTIAETAVSGRSTNGKAAAQLIGYVVFDGEPVEPAILRDYLRDRLPPFMVPDVFVPLETIPRLPNGKVDYSSLPDPQEHVRRGGAQVAPRTDRERVLAAIWSDLLGHDPVGVRDDFFELGGDSIMSIRMISRARQAGIHIAPGQITSHPTIEQLAATSDAAGPSGDAVSGKIPLGPIQRWFFEMALAAPDHWNQSSLFSIDAAVDEAALKRALQACVEHHDMLRARFVHLDGAWDQLVDPDVLVKLEVTDEAADVDAIVGVCQRSLDLGAGPAIQATLITRPSTEPDLLFLAAHHLVIDVVSWAILVDDLERAYLQASTGADTELAARSTSYRDWVSHLASDEWAEREREFWSANRGGSSESLPESWGTEASRQTVTVELEADVTGLLLGKANDAFRTRPDELMVAALAPVLASPPEERVTLALERHGRPPDLPGVDLTRTIGWFTAQYPVTLTSSATDDAGLIKATKETLRSVPNGGVGYGALRYLHRLPELVGRAEPAYIFNYIGRASTDGGGLFRRLSWCDDSSRHPDNGRAHRIEIVAVVRDGQLAVDWHFSSLHDDRETVEAMARAHLEGVRRLVSHCVADDSGSLTPSDFPAAGLNQDELDRFLDGLE
jgi:amino acid adenylation domain-containing protein/non-ribosomal peptide synthase protein (TIGR01720 family)